MEPIKLEDLVPEGAEFKLGLTNKTYKLRPFSAKDEIWLSRKYGNDLEKIFAEVRMAEICTIILHQLEDATDFASRDVTVVNELGDKVTEKLGGVELLLSLISGFQEKIDVFKALLQTIGISRPVFDKLGVDTTADAEKKRPIGDSSSTSSVPNTDGPPITSSP